MSAGWLLVIIAFAFPLVVRGIMALEDWLIDRKERG